MQRHAVSRHRTSARHPTRTPHTQVHYLKVRPPDDHSGVTLLLKPHAVPYAAGLVSFASWFTIPPGKKSHPIVNTCCYKYGGGGCGGGAAGWRVESGAGARSPGLQACFDSTQGPVRSGA